MKRLEREPDRVARLPNEIVVEIILESFRYRIKDISQWHHLHHLFTQLIELHQWKRITIYSKLQYVCQEVMRWKLDSLPGKFHQIEKIELRYTPACIEREAWEKVLLNVPNLKNLKFSCQSDWWDVRGLTNLEKLVCPGMISNRELMNLTRLKKLRIDQMNNLTKEGFSYLTNLTNLSLLYPVDDGSEILDNLKGLRSFTLFYDATMFVIPLLENLTELSLSQTVVNLNRIKLENLTILRIRSSRVDMDCERLTNLKKLALRDMSNFGIGSFTILTGLISLALVGKCDLLKFPVKFPNLTELNLNNSFIPFYRERYPQLKSLHLVDNKTTFNYHLSKMPQLTHLNLRDSTRINGDCFTSLVGLKRLDISQNTRIDREAISHLTNLELLTTDDNHEFYVEGLCTERWPSGRYEERLLRMKFFLDD